MYFFVNVNTKIYKEKEKLSKSLKKEKAKKQRPLKIYQILIDHFQTNFLFLKRYNRKMSWFQ